MPRLVEPRGRREEVVLAVQWLIQQGGLAAVTMRAVSAQSRVSASSLIDHFTSRDRMLMIVAWVTGEQRLREVHWRSRDEGVLAWLPSTSEECSAARVWLAMVELGRSDAAVGQRVAEIRRAEWKLLDVVTGQRLGEAALDGLYALAEGLTAAVCSPDPLPLERARAALARHLPPPGEEPEVRSSA